MPLKHVLLAITVVLLWSLNLIAVKQAVQEVPVFVLTSFRFLVVGICTIPWLRVRRKIDLFHLFILAIILGLGHFATFFYGMKFVGAGLTAIILNTQVPMAMIMAKLLLHEKSSLKQNIGVVLALLGIFVLFWDPEAIANLYGVLLLTIASLTWGLSSVYMRKYMQSYNSTSVLCGMSLFSTVLLAGLAVLNGQNFTSLLHVSFKTELAIAYIIICSTFIGYGFWFYLLKVYKIMQLSPYLLLMPVFGVILGITVAGEEISIAKIIGAILVIIGVAACTIGTKADQKTKL